MAEGGDNRPFYVVSYPHSLVLAPGDHVTGSHSGHVQPLTLLEGKLVPQCPIHAIQMSVCVRV